MTCSRAHRYSLPASTPPTPPLHARTWLHSTSAKRSYSIKAQSHRNIIRERLQVRSSNPTKVALMWMCSFLTSTNRIAFHLERPQRKKHPNLGMEAPKSMPRMMSTRHILLQTQHPVIGTRTGPIRVSLTHLQIISTKQGCFLRRLKVWTTCSSSQRLDYESLPTEVSEEVAHMSQKTQREFRVLQVNQCAYCTRF